MYDLKTHEAKYISEHKDFYEDQLNVYAHVWQKLRNNHLDHTAIISTALPEKVRNAMKFGDEEIQNLALKEWEPVIEIEYKEENVQETIKEFTRVVYDIEDRIFSPPDEEKILANLERK